MAESRFEAIRRGDTRTVSQKGGLTLPKEWRDEHDVEPGDVLAVYRTEDGTLEVLPPE